MNAYVDKLKDPRWQKKRLEILQRDDFKCQKCGNTQRTLHVHHKKYEWKLDPWEYDNKLLITLCDDCHETEGLMKGCSNMLVEAMYKAGCFNEHFSMLAYRFESLIENMGEGEGQTMGLINFMEIISCLHHNESFRKAVFELRTQLHDSEPF